jgi:hypothetical protein
VAAQVFCFRFRATALRYVKDRICLFVIYGRLRALVFARLRFRALFWLAIFESLSFGVRDSALAFDLLSP